MLPVLRVHWGWVLIVVSRRGEFVWVGQEGVGVFRLLGEGTKGGGWNYRKNLCYWWWDLDVASEDRHVCGCMRNWMALLGR